MYGESRINSCRKLPRPILQESILDSVISLWQTAIEPCMPKNVPHVLAHLNQYDKSNYNSQIIHARAFSIQDEDDRCEIHQFNISHY